MVAFLLNNQLIQQDLNEGKVLLDFLRDEQALTGTKQACREGDCGACIVLSGRLVEGVMHYQPVNSCLLPLGLVDHQHIVSIEGLNGESLNRVQQALVDQNAIQCGFCTPGLVMAITAFLLSSAESSNALALKAVSGNLCRCTGYAGIKRALKQICKQFDLGLSPADERIAYLIKHHVLPHYFATIPQRLELLPASSHTKDPLAIKVAGGTDLFVQQAEQLAQQPLNFITHQDNIRIDDQQCVISAATTIEALRLSSSLHELLPRLAEDFKLICSASIRQRATLGGNLVNASPIGDLSVFFLALNADLNISSASGQRKIALRNFFQAYKQVDLKVDEIISSLEFEYSKAPILMSYEKVSKRMHLDIASVNTAMSLCVEENAFRQIHISVGGVAAIPLYLHKTCALLQGETITVTILQQGLELAQTETSPLADTRGSVEYKRLLLRQLLIAHWLKLLPDYVSWEEFQ